MTAMPNAFAAVLTTELLQHNHCKFTYMSKITLMVVIVALQFIWDGVIMAVLTFYQLFCPCY